MSSLIYLAAEIPFWEVKNPHNQTLSIHEALARGMEVPSILLQDKNIDRDNPDMLLFTDSFQIDPENGIWKDYEFDDDFSICPMEKSEDMLTQKKYCASLQWNNYTKGRAQRVICYIREILMNTPQVEIWHIWMGAAWPPPRIRRMQIPVEKLVPEVLERLDAFEVWKTERVISQEIPREWEIQEDELETNEQYCYEIIRG